jgi:VWFA-related protein
MRTFLAITLAGIVASGQQTAPTAAPQPNRTTFSSTTSLVAVDVTARDKSGTLIEGLKPSDFTLLEDGKPQKISVFEFEKLAIDPAPPEKPPTLKDADIVPAAPKKMISTEEPGKIQYHDKRLLVFFFDLGSMAIPEQLRAQDAALTFLDKQFTPADMVAIMMYTASLEVLTDFTDDRDQLKDIINNLPVGEMAELAGMADDGSDDSEDSGAAFVADETEFNIFNTDRKLQAIEDAAKKLSGRDQGLPPQSEHVRRLRRL